MPPAKLFTFLSASDDASKNFLNVFISIKGNILSLRSYAWVFKLNNTTVCPAQFKNSLLPGIYNVFTREKKLFIALTHLPSKIAMPRISLIKHLFCFTERIKDFLF